MIRPRLWMVGILLLAGLLRFPFLADYPSAWHHDHMGYGAEARAFTWAAITERHYSIGMPFLGISKAAFAVFGEHLWVIRLPAALAGFATVALIYLLGRDLFSRRTGLIAAALASTQHVLLLYSRLPGIGEPVPFTLLALWLGLRAWRTARWWCWLLSGAIAGFTLWAIWEALVTLPMLGAGFVVLCLARPHAVLERWRGWCWWLLGFTALTPLIHPRDLRTVLEGLGNRTHSTWTLGQWIFQVQHGLGTFVWYADAGGWGRWDDRAMLLPFEVVVLFLGACLVPWRLATVLCWVWVFVVGICGGVLIIDPANWYHLLYAMPFLMLLVALPLADLPMPVAVPLILLTMSMNLHTLWPAVAHTLPHPAVVAARVMADHRDAECIGLIDTFADQPFPRAPLYAFVADAPVLRGVMDCPITIVLPRVGNTGLPCRALPSSEGPVQVCGGDHESD